MSKTFGYVVMMVNDNGSILILTQYWSTLPESYTHTCAIGNLIWHNVETSLTLFVSNKAVYQQ